MTADSVLMLGRIVKLEKQLAAAERVVEAAREDRDEHERAVLAQEQECPDPCAFSNIDAALERFPKAYFADPGSPNGIGAQAQRNDVPVRGGPGSSDLNSEKQEGE